MLARAALPAALALYLGAGLTHLGLPGLQYDEAYDPLVAVEMLTGQSPSCAMTVTLSGQVLPVMLRDYEGPTSVYTSLAGLSLLGISVEALRITQLAIGALTLVLLWLLARRWFGDAVAGLATLLCATAPAFVFWSRSGSHWMLPQLPIALGMVLALDRWRRTGGTFALASAAFLFGFGVTSKILFVWMAAPILLTAAVLAGRSRLPRVPWAAVAAGLLLGLGPLVVYNLDGMPTLRRIAENAVTTRLYGHSNLDVLTNVSVQSRSFAAMIGGSIVPIAAPAGLPVGGPLLAVGLLVPVWVLVHRRRRVATEPDLAARLFLVLTVVTVVPISTVSLSHLGATYLFLIVPFTWLVVAVALSDASRFGGGRAPAFAAAALGLALVAHNVAGSVRIHRFFVATGGRGFWSDTIVAVAGRLESENRPVVAMDWGFSRNIAFLTRGRLCPQEFFEYLPEPSPRLAETCDTLLQEPARLYLFHVERHTAFRGVFPVLEWAAARRGLSLRLFASFPERDGLPNTLVYEAVPGS